MSCEEFMHLSNLADVKPSGFQVALPRGKTPQKLSDHGKIPLITANVMKSNRWIHMKLPT